ncbi:hypothetical protein TWF694_003986 [Orbilia ellipsospora]|uniref:Uncharacterized protein n=1 Tax=Orbilia ellipsospora TaxID=2528407 RepID=A0AAV9WX04_9PEZI
MSLKLSSPLVIEVSTKARSLVDHGAVGAEHGITAHSAYCRFNDIKQALKAELEASATALSPDETKASTALASTLKKKIKMMKFKKEKHDESGESDYYE